MFESSNELVLSVLVLLSGGVICAVVARWLNLHLILAVAFYSWHSLFGFYYARYVLLNGGDAFAYYIKARFGFVEPGLGTDFVEWLTSFPTSVGITYWPITFIYNFVGAIGVLLVYAALRETVAAGGRSTVGKWLPIACIFVPSFSFWTSGIGKDSLGCLAVGLFVWSTVRFSRRQPAAIAAILIMLSIRPHIATLMVLSVAVGTVFAAELRGLIRFGAVVLATAAAFFAVPMALVYSGSTQFMSITDFVSDRQEQNLGGGSSLDIAGMNPALRLLTFLYRPLPNEAEGLQQYATAIENLLLLVLTLLGLAWVYKAGAARVFRQQSILLFYGISCAILLSQVTANLGIATRQKWMLFPALMVVFVSAWSMCKAHADERRRQLQPSPAARQAAR